MGDCRIQFLDATLRDGGFALEDLCIKGLSNRSFTAEDVAKIAKSIAQSKADIIEIGAVEISPNDKRKFAIHQNIESISKAIPAERADGQKFAFMYRGPDTPLDRIPNWNASLCELPRVILRYSELTKSLDFCKALTKKGYKVCVQPMVTARYSSAELELVLAAANEMGAYAVYFVDSYGYMMAKDVEHYFKLYSDKLDPKIRIGFHAHNNIGLAFANVLHFLEISEGRNVIVDACALGSGQGAGNCQSELLVPYLNELYGKAYDYDSILDACETIEQVFGDEVCRHSPTFSIPAIRRAAYKYSVDMRRKCGFGYREIDRVLSDMSYDLKQRYTPKNLETVLAGGGAT